MRIHTILPAILALAALPAEATTTYYCDSACGSNTEAAFNTAFGALITAGLTSSGTVNFTGETSGTTVFNVGPTNVDFTGFNGASTLMLNVVGSQLQNSLGGNPNVGIVISLPGSIYALGTHVKGSSSAIVCFEATAFNCDINGLVLSSSATSFVGVISSVVLPNYQFRGTSQSGKVYVNDFIMAETPEGATFLLVGAGLILLPLLKRRARARGAEQSRQSAPLGVRREPGASPQT